MHTYSLQDSQPGFSVHQDSQLGNSARGILLTVLHHFICTKIIASSPVNGAAAILGKCNNMNTVNKWNAEIVIFYEQHLQTPLHDIT